ncbi:hypothetical protein BJX76DRAFT_329453 [Aspergillus varians]
MPDACSPVCPFWLVPLLYCFARPLRMYFFLHSSIVGAEAWHGLAFLLLLKRNIKTESAAGLKSRSDDNDFSVTIKLYASLSLRPAQLHLALSA